MISRLKNAIFGVMQNWYVGVCLAVALFAVATHRFPQCVAAGRKPSFQKEFRDPDEDYNVTLPSLSRTYQVGDMVTIGGPNAINWLGDAPMNVYIVPHKLWRDGDSIELP